MPEQIKQDFKARIYESTGLDEKKYKQYQDSIRVLRDKYFAHRDPNWQNHIPLCIPEFDNALTIAKQYKEWLRWLLEKEDSDDLGHRLNKIIQDAEAEVRKLSAI